MKKTQNKVHHTVKYSKCKLNRKDFWQIKTNAKYNSYKYKDWNYFKFFCVFYLVGGRWVGNQWVSGEPDGGSGVSDQWLVGQWRAHRWVGGLVVGCRWMGWRPVGGSKGQWGNFRWSAVNCCWSVACNMPSICAG